MNSLFQILLVLHIAGGAAGLLSGSIAASVKKGNAIHKLSGKVFFYGMLTASLSALVLSWLPGHPNLFLFAVGGFTLYMILTGYRIIWLKRELTNNTRPISVLDYGLSLFGLLFGLYLLFQSVNLLVAGKMFGLVPGVFGLVCINYARMDYALLSGKKGIRAAWMANHITRMMGALIASYTAFLVVNVNLQPEWLLWLLPTLIGSILIAGNLRKYAPLKNKSN